MMFKRLITLEILSSFRDFFRSRRDFFYQGNNFRCDTKKRKKKKKKKKRERKNVGYALNNEIFPLNKR